MLIKDQHPLNKSIMVSVLGEPNVGKSSLINTFLGMNLSVVTHKPQTTRNRFHCVMNIDRTEIIWVDTPGLHKSNKEFNKRLNEQARHGADGADLNLLLVDLSGKDVLGQILRVKEVYGRDLSTSWVVFTKCDLVENYNDLPLKEVFESAQALIPTLSKYFIVSSKKEENIHILTGEICDAAESSPHLYPGGEVSNKSERFFVTEYIREQAFLLLKEELPYELAVVIDDYRDFRGDADQGKLAQEISATILVNRPSQRAIVVGSKGSMIRDIGTNARMKIEEMVGGQIHLNLHVKVTPKWFKNNFILETIGLPRATDSNRVWRSK